MFQIVISLNPYLWCPSQSKAVYWYNAWWSFNSSPLAEYIPTVSISLKSLSNCSPTSKTCFNKSYPIGLLRETASAWAVLVVFLISLPTQSQLPSDKHTATQWLEILRENEGKKSWVTGVAVPSVQFLGCKFIKFILRNNCLLLLTFVNAIHHRSRRKNVTPCQPKEILPHLPSCRLI